MSRQDERPLTGADIRRSLAAKEEAQKKAPKVPSTGGSPSKSKEG